MQEAQPLLTIKKQRPFIQASKKERNELRGFPNYKQNFEALKKECLENGVLFQDPHFPLDNASLFAKGRAAIPNVKWIRPKDLCADPHMFIQGPSRFDVKQGHLGDCWFLAAVANLTLNRALFRHVVPTDQDFGHEYAGIFHFRFWQYGKWIEVVVDDRLPTEEGKLIMLHSTETGEFWSALLEKAYAKLYGSYAALDGGTPSEAMEDFTGGVSVRIDLEDAGPELYDRLLAAYRRNTLLTCSTKPGGVTEMRTPEGVVKGHAYSITMVHVLQRTSSLPPVQLLRIRNPWGDHFEWKGAWSDGSAEWNDVGLEEVAALELSWAGDGEFWMAYTDWKTRFDAVELCLLEAEYCRNSSWESHSYFGEWHGPTAGGCRNNPETFHCNPQYMLTVSENDTFLVALMQCKYTERALLQPIGFEVWKVEDPEKWSKPLPREFFDRTPAFLDMPNFRAMREVVTMSTFQPGDYVIVPSKFDPNDVGKFLLRIFSYKRSNLVEHDSEIQEKERETYTAEGESAIREAARLHFQKLAAEDSEIDWSELRDILNSLNLAPTRTIEAEPENSLNCFFSCFISNTPPKQEVFSSEICRCLVALKDDTRDGKLNFEEFQQLLSEIKDWVHAFYEFGVSKTGTLNMFELRDALRASGYILGNSTLAALCYRYSDLSYHISLENFIMCAVKIKAMIHTFKMKDVNNSNSATFTFKEWMEATLYS